MHPVDYRALRPSDADRVVDVLLASRALDGPLDPISRAQLRHAWFDFPGLDLERDTFAAAGPDGEVVGFAAAFPRDQVTGAARAFIPGTVHPGSRRAGIGGTLLRAAEARALEQLAGMPPDLERQLDGDVHARSAGQIALFEGQGYRPVREFATMRRDLCMPLPTPPEVPGIVFTTWRDDLAEATRLAHNDAFRDHWGSDPLSPEAWHHYVQASPEFSPTGSWLALDDATVAGYALCHVPGIDGRGFGWLGTVGVRRAYRRRGIGAGVVARSLRSCHDEGLATLGLAVDADNPTGAIGVYTSLGFVIGDRSIVYSKRIPG